MFHLNYNHLYYFWMTQKKGSVTQAAEALYLTPQTITGQIRQLEERLGGRLFKRKGRNIEATELGQLVFRYADKMFSLSYEMLEVVTFQKENESSFNVGIADVLSKRIASKILLAALPSDSSVHLRCIESTHEMLLVQLREHKLDVILSDCPLDSTQHPDLLSKKLGECGVSFFCQMPLPEKAFPECLMERKLLIPAKRTAMGRQLTRWFDEQGLAPQIFGEFDDAALMKAFGLFNQGIFVAPTLYQEEFLDSQTVALLGQTDALKEEYYAIFAERMIQHPAVKRLCESDFSALFAGLEQ
ncbi:MAG: transcriptional activator NhaR [Gammaproteobacteria bacterium]|uniref:Transcriptional activator protein NhaR n=1 Tax=Tolumonas osonensis TaxID=675874 RepID=A0A841GQE3_9GAMM|nr:LysR family transcriptional activator of nhaA [Tolumonas osonensis]NCB58751.1 transcriptional activator NhaR [Gammaproteobacteria bacterium]